MSSKQPKIGVLSARGFLNEPWFAPLRDFEDLLVSAYSAVVHKVEPQRGLFVDVLNTRATLAQKAVKFGMRPVIAEPKLPAGEPYDVLFVIGNDSGELGYALRVPNWRDCARQVVVLHDEIWPANTARDRRWLGEVLSRADLVVTSSSSPDALAEFEAVVSLPLFRRPRSIEVETFVGRNSARPIDVFGYGRCDDGQNDVLERWATAEDADRWYQHEVGYVSVTGDVRHYRASLGRKLNRSKLVVCNAARFDSYGGSGEYGTRFIEAAAAGAGFVGRFPKSAAFDTDLGGLEGLVAMAVGPQADTAALDDYLADDARQRRVAVEHRVHALREHDSAHSLAAVIARCDLPLAEGVRARIAHLDQVAAQISRVVSC